jgi:hypothetical protein
VLRLDREVEGLALIQIGGFPDPFEQVETKVTPEGFLDHVAVAPSHAGSFYSNGTQRSLVERDSRPRFRHKRIIAS